MNRQKNQRHFIVKIVQVPMSLCILNILLFNKKFPCFSSFTQSELCYIYKSTLNIFWLFEPCMCFSKNVKLLFNIFSFLSVPLFSAHITDLSYKWMYMNTYPMCLIIFHSAKLWSKNIQRMSSNNWTWIKVSLTLTTSKKRRINWTICNIAQNRRKRILLYANHNELVSRSIVWVLQYFNAQCFKFAPNRLLFGSYHCAY